LRDCAKDCGNILQRDDQGHRLYRRRNKQYEQKIKFIRLWLRTTNEIFTETSKTLWIGSYSSTATVSSLAELVIRYF